jgi:hypothetical protein
MEEGFLYIILYDAVPLPCMRLEQLRKIIMAEIRALSLPLALGIASVEF